MIDSSPRRLEMTSPSTKTWSPRRRAPSSAAGRLVADAGEATPWPGCGCRPGLQCREAELAGVSAEDHTARDSHSLAGLGARLEPAVPRSQIGDRVGDRQRHRIGAACGIRPFGDEPSRWPRRTAFCSNTSSSVGSAAGRVGHRGGLLAKSGRILSAMAIAAGREQPAPDRLRRGPAPPQLPAHSATGSRVGATSVHVRALAERVDSRSDLGSRRPSATWQRGARAQPM